MGFDNYFFPTISLPFLLQDSFNMNCTVTKLFPGWGQVLGGGGRNMFIWGTILPEMQWLMFGAMPAKLRNITAKLGPFKLVCFKANTTTGWAISKIGELF